MITLIIVCNWKGTRKEKIQMFFTSLALDSMYIIPMMLDYIG